MSIRRCPDQVNSATKEMITVLWDEFGGKHLVQTPLLLPDADHEARVQQETVLLAANEAAFIEALRRHGKSEAEIAALKKDPKDCGCGA